MSRFSMVLLLVAAAAFVVGRASVAERLLIGESRWIAPEQTTHLEAELARLRQELVVARRRMARAVETVASGERPAEIPDRRESARVATGLLNFSGESARLMSVIEAHLGRGEEGFLTLLEELTEEERFRVLERIIEDGDGAQLYPWLRFLVTHEQDVVEMTDWLLTSMADDPKRFEEIDRELLEMLVTSVTALLPGMVSPDRLLSSKAQAVRILDTPKHLQPEGIRKARNEIQDLLERDWAVPR